MPTSLGTLLRNAFFQCRARLRPFLIGVVLFGSLVAIVNVVASKRIEGHIWQGMQRLGIDQSRMMELQEQLQSGDEGAVEGAMNEMNTTMGGIDGMSDEDREALFRREGIVLVLRVLPVMTAGLFVLGVLTILSGAYFLCFALGKGKEPTEILNNALFLFLPLLGVWVWSFLRSFVWIPIFGIIPAIILMPRFALAPVILASQKKGVTASVTESYRKTRGYWGRIAGNLAVAGLIFMLVSWGVSLVTIPVALQSKVLSIWIQAVVQQATVGYTAVFLVLLTKTILENAQPQVKSGKKAKA
ncbi:hypothetical protein A2881_02605 [Candidatus Peribacteria bacterium RIFCSPHIGHO2_01_FULL_55_13]|nr:MAG: hypothetical protein A2881_02605 [Candidatus Peribacteria bacterium RIFCSPHIGHO2_01_FULL_55_13]